MEKEYIKIVSDKADKTFRAIKHLRKTMPQDRRWQRDELKRKEKELQDQWWEEVKDYFIKDENDPPFRGNP